MPQQILFEDGTSLNSSQEIHEEVIHYFQAALSTEGVQLMNIWKDLFQAIITGEENDLLCQSPILEEVNRALFDIPKHNSPRPDGFGYYFFMHCQDVIKENLVETATNVFSGTPLPQFYSSAFIVIVPKEEKPSSFAKVRLISLCSVSYKVVSKIIVNRLNPILAKVVSKEQGAFIRGYNIHENITVAQEMLHSINSKLQCSNVMIKVDMSKTYDRLEFSFILEVLQVLRFSTKLRQLISNCITTPYFFIFMNGTIKGYSPSS